MTDEEELKLLKKENSKLKLEARLRKSLSVELERQKGIVQAAKEEAEKQRALLEYRQRKWLLEQRKLKREKERRENLEDEIVNDADALEGGGGSE